MRETIKLAIEWIEKQPEETPHTKYDLDTRYVVLRELEAALAQPEQEGGVCGRCGGWVSDPVITQPEQDWIERERAVGYREGHQNALKQMAQPEQEPVAVVNANDEGYWADILPDRNVKVGQFLYTTPPQRNPLTHEQRFDLLTKFEPHKNKWEAPAILIDMVEAAHNIKE